MSRSGYTEDYDYDNWSTICWRGAVCSAINGKRGQEFLKEMLIAMDSLEQKRLIKNDLENNGEFCALGTVGKHRGIDMSNIDPDDRETVANTFDIAPALATEIVYMNDEYSYGEETPEKRFERMREYVSSLIKP